MRFFEGVKLFNFEIVSKTPNMVFFYVSMAFSVGITHKLAKWAIFTLLYTFYVLQLIYLKKSKRLQYLWLKNDKKRQTTPFVSFIEGVE